MVQRVDFLRGGPLPRRTQQCNCCGGSLDKEYTIELGMLELGGEVRPVAVFCGFECRDEWRKKDGNG